MKKTFQSAFITLLELVAVRALLLATPSCDAGNFTYLMNGTYTTNANAAWNSGTNSSGVNTNNFYIGTTLALSNSFYYLSAYNGSTPAYNTNFSASGTNSWPPLLPAEVVNIQGNYPNTLYGPSRINLWGFQPALMTTNVGISSVTAVFAGSIDGLLWQANIFSIVATIPVNSLFNTNGLATTNYDSGAWPIIALYEINNTNGVNLTNMVVLENSKPGL
jgi:hypothetical protein